MAEEWGRLAPLFRRIERRQLAVALSIDTRHAEVARRAAEHGVALLNLPFPQELCRRRGPMRSGCDQTASWPSSSRL